MNDFETIYNNNELNESVAKNTAKLLDYIKTNMELDIFEDTQIKRIKRYITKDTVEFVFNYNDTMYIAKYFIKDSEYEINKLV